MSNGATQPDHGVRILEGMPLQRYVRDARVICISERASKVQRNIITRNVIA